MKLHFPATPQPYLAYRLVRATARGALMVLGCAGILVLIFAYSAAAILAGPYLGIQWFAVKVGLEDKPTQ